MPNLTNDKTKNIWTLNITPKATQQSVLHLDTSGKYLDRDIELVVDTMGASADKGTVSLAPLIAENGTNISLDIKAESSNSNIALQKVSVADSKNTTEYPYYFQVSANGSNKQIITGAVTGNAPGFIATGEELVPQGNKSVTITANSKSEYVNLKSGELESEVKGSIEFTPSVTTDMNSFQSPPSETPYYTITPSGSSSGSVSGAASVKTEGYVKTETASGGSYTGEIKNGNPIYIEQSDGFVSGGKISVHATLSADNSATATGATNIGSKLLNGSASTTKPTIGSFIAIKGAIANTGSSSITFTTSKAGYLPAGWKKTGSASLNDSSSTNSLFYIPITNASGSWSSNNQIVGINNVNIEKPTGVSATVGDIQLSTGYNFKVTGSSDQKTEIQTYEVTTPGYISSDLQRTVTYSASDKVKYINIQEATFANEGSSGKTYTDKSTTAPVLKSGDFLYINEGYLPNTKISLAQLVPDNANITSESAPYLLSNYKAYDKDGNLITGTMKTLTNASFSTSTTGEGVDGAGNKTGVASTYKISASESGYISNGTTIKDMSIYQGGYTLNTINV